MGISISLHFSVFRFTMKLSWIFKRRRERERKRVFHLACAVRKLLPGSLIKNFRLLFLQITIAAGSWQEMYFRKQRKHVQLFGFWVIFIFGTSNLFAELFLSNTAFGQPDNSQWVSCCHGVYYTRGHIFEFSSFIPEAV